MGSQDNSASEFVTAKVGEAAESLTSLAGLAKETASAAVKATTDHAKDIPSQVGEAAQHLMDQAGQLMPRSSSRRGSWGVAALVIAAVIGLVIWRRARS